MAALVWVLLALQAAGAAVTPVPAVVKSAVEDKQSTPSPDLVKLTGLLGRRLAASESKRLLVVDEEELLAGFRKKPGKQAWIGEHVGKWLHAATLMWVYTDDAKLREKLDRVATELIKTQEPDGYLGTYLPENRWTAWDVWVHKYDLIGLLTYHRYTGNKPALDAARKVGDLLCATFGDDKRDIVKAGEHVGMAATSVLEPMILLYRLTGDEKYLHFCEYIIRSWDQPHGPRVLSSLSEGKGVHQTANGKAYEMLSNLVGLCEMYRVTGDEKLLKPVLHAWQDIVDKRLYITGAASQRELFRDDHHLPNEPDNNIGETCVTTTWIQLNLQLLRLLGEPRFAEMIERTAYNHLLGAQRPAGDAWCYYTAMEGTKPYGNRTNCCVSSGPRGLALLPTLAYTVDADGVVVNLYEKSTAKLTLNTGLAVAMEQATVYPTDDVVTLKVKPAQEAQFAVKLRIPQWCPNVTLSVNNSPAPESTRAGEYTILKRVWRKDGDTISLRMELPFRVIEGTHTNAGKVALMRGPLVLAADEGSNPQTRPVQAVSVPADVKALDLQIKPMAENRRTWRGEKVYQVQVCLAAPASAPASGPTSATAPTSTEPYSGPPRRATLELVPFYLAGSDGSYYRVWFPTADAPCKR